MVQKIFRSRGHIGESQWQKRFEANQIIGFKRVLTPKQIVAKMSLAQLRNRFSEYSDLSEAELRAHALRELQKQE